MKPALLICLLAALLSACASPNAPGNPGTFKESAPTLTARAAMRTPASAPVQTATVQPPRAGSGTEPELLAARVPRAQPGSKAKTATLADGLDGFAFELYRAAGKGKDDNLIFSPYSIGMAFSMVYAGARGKTDAQMRDVLGFLPQEEHHPAANGLERHLAELGTGAPSPNQEQGEAFRLKVANAVWGQRGFPFLDAYLQTLAGQYGAGVRAIDFQSNPEGGRKRVNDWVADQTEDRIRNIVPPGVIDPQTRMVLANAIYFKAAWLFPFEEDATKDGSFTLLDGSSVVVPMMTHDEDIPYAKGNGYQAVVLPYTGNTVDMVIIVPNAGRFDAVEHRLSTGFLRNARAASERGRATITMPRFDFESDVPLTDLLPRMGMPDAFRPYIADFSGIAGNNDLYISAAIHRATIKVDEKGTEATAATALVVRVVSAPATPPPHLTIDRPFIFAITERETGSILFLGHVTNPAK